MKISISTAGWQPRKMAASAALLLLLGFPTAFSFGRQQTGEEPEFLEYLGTFETAGGKELDPLAFQLVEKAAAPAPAKADKGKRRQSERRRPASAAADNKGKDRRNE